MQTHQWGLLTLSSLLLILWGIISFFLQRTKTQQPAQNVVDKWVECHILSVWMCCFHQRSWWKQKCLPPVVGLWSATVGCGSAAAAWSSLTNKDWVFLLQTLSSCLQLCLQSLQRCSVESELRWLKMSYLFVSSKRVFNWMNCLSTLWSISLCFVTFYLLHLSWIEEQTFDHQSSYRLYTLLVLYLNGRSDPFSLM